MQPRDLFDSLSKCSDERFALDREPFLCDLPVPQAAKVAG